MQRAEPYVIISFFSPNFSQVPVAVVTPGGQPTSAMGRSVASYSGHILKLVPGDHQWSLPQFPIVIIWNGAETFCPTQFVKADAITDWKLGIICRHLGEAVKLFEEVESGVEHSHKKALKTSFRNLRNCTIVTDMLLGDKIAGHSQNIPPVMYGAKKGTSTPLTYPVDPNYRPEAQFRHDLDPDVINIAGRPAKATDSPTAPLRGTFAFFPDPTVQFPVQEFVVPVEDFISIPDSVIEKRNLQKLGVTTGVDPAPIPPPDQPPQEPAPQPPVVPTARHVELFKSISTRQTGKAAPSIKVTIPQQSSSKTTTSVSASATTTTVTTSSTQQGVTSSRTQPTSTSSSSSTYVKKFNCRFCKYSTDRKNDWDNHCNTHTGFRYKCGEPTCKKVFSSTKNRDFHYRNVHLAIKRFTCSVEKCNHQENDYGKMRVHMYEAHGIGEECRCKHCDKKFGNFRVLERHEQSCQTEKDKKCPVCRKGYKSRERLISHMEAQHGDTELMMCEKCGGIFTTQESLRVHQAQHKSK